LDIAIRAVSAPTAAKSISPASSAASVVGSPPGIEANSVSILSAAKASVARAA
jgi:hypothetical protein